MGLLDQLKRRRQKLQAELAEVERAIAAVEATAIVTNEALINAHQSGNEISMGTLQPMVKSIARAKHASAGAVEEGSKAFEFVRTIGIPHAGGPGYTMRSLAEKLRTEGYRVSHVTLSRALNYDSLDPGDRRPINPKVAARIKQLTGVPLSFWPAIAASK